MDHKGRLVVKIGSSTVTSGAGTLDLGTMGSLVDQLAQIAADGHEVLVVTSGAIAAGTGRLGLVERPRTIPGQQAAAAVGQGLLMRAYTAQFDRHALITAQVLLTQDDFQSRRRYLNARNALFALLKQRVVPIINENDTVAVEEIRVGDNDMLGALVTVMVGASRLIILSDVEGLLGADGRVIREVADITPEINALAGGPGSTVGTGGMRTKLEAARICAQAGAELVIACGRAPDVLAQAVAGQTGTRFPALRPATSSRKHWIGLAAPVRGRVVANARALAAVLDQGKSLLPAGVIHVAGSFAAGDTVALCNEAGDEVARGSSNYSAEDLRKIMGRNTAEIAGILGVKTADEAVHRDNMLVAGVPRP